MKRTPGVAITLLLGLLHACASFTSGDEPTEHRDGGQGPGDAQAEVDAPPGALPARSVSCNPAECTGNDVCCVQTTGNGTCAKTCADREVACDDTADCAAFNLVCCVTLAINPDGRSAGLVSAGCRTSCTAPDQRRACATPAECAGKGCDSIDSFFDTFFPSYPLRVCEP